MELTKALGKAIGMCRQSRGMSLSDLARASDCSISYLSMLENGKRDATVSTVEKIAAALQIPTSLLFFLAARRGDLQGMGPELAAQVANVTLELLKESRDQQTLI